MKFYTEYPIRNARGDTIKAVKLMLYSYRDTLVLGSEKSIINYIEVFRILISVVSSRRSLTLSCICMRPLPARR